MTKFVISSSFFSPQELMSSYVNYKIWIVNLEIYVCVISQGSHNAYILYHNPTFLDLYQCDNVVYISL